MPNPVAYFELGARDAAKLRDFYSDLFGWNVEPFGRSAAGTDYFHIEPSDGGIAGGVIQTNENMPPSYVMVYVSVGDLQAALDRAASLGGTVVVPPMTIQNGAGQIAVFTDPEGNTIGLHKFEEAEDG